MASGRRSSDPTDLLLVDPSQPGATEWTRKHLTKRQKDIFIQYGFSKALLREVIAAGWDQVDINNYVLYYNSQVETKLAMPAPGLDMSMKKAINTVIRTKLQEQEEREIGVVTPVNPKVPSTGDPPEPDPGMLPPGTEKNHWRERQTQYKLAICEGTSGRIEKSIGKEEQCAAQAAKAAKVAKAAKRSRVKAPKGGVKRLHRF